MVLKSIELGISRTEYEMKHCEKYVIPSNLLLWKCCGNRPKQSGNCAFPQNFHTSKLGEITVFYEMKWKYS